MYRLSRLTGDAKYATAADSCAAYTLKNCRKSNGLLVWGSHIYWDCYKDEASGDDGGKGPHEILVFQPEWEEMYRVNPVAVREEIEGIWKWHVIDKKTGYHNRHDDGRRGFDFAFSGGSLILAFAFMHKATKEPRWLERARLVSDWHWNARNKKTGLTPDTPGSRNRYDGRHSFTNQAGIFASQLLGAYEIGSRVSTVGFDWPTGADVVDKIEEEVAELRQAVEGGTAGHQEEEMGDLLFSIANLARKLGIEPEAALRRANRKFCERFDELERRLKDGGRALGNATPEEMEAAWQDVKDRT
jgi:phosphoribosyl-ATP pyrophosphohydrolase